MTPERLKELTKLANSESYSDRLKAAQALDLPLELQEILVRDRDSWIRCSLAHNTSVTDIQIQEILAKDSDSIVRRWLVQNTSFTDRKLWEILRNDKDEVVSGVINRRIEEEKDKIKAEFKNKILNIS